jgi:hypothetical protein
MGADQGAVQVVVTVCYVAPIKHCVAAGVHGIPWNGVTSRGEEASPGVYFCRLVMEGVAETKQFVVLR